jgi:hypothetical protein
MMLLQTAAKKLWKCFSLFFQHHYKMTYTCVWVVGPWYNEKSYCRIFNVNVESICQQPQRRRNSPRLSSYWILVVDRTGSSLEKYHLVQLDGRNITENTVESSFPHCIIQRMPSYMNNILSAIKTKSLYCLFCYENLLDYIGKMAAKYSCS